MNIMKVMRSSKVLYFLLWLVIISFVIWIFAIYGGGGQTSGRGMGSSYIVKVGKRSLAPKTLNLALQFQREMIKNYIGEQYVEQFMKDAHKRAVSNFIDSLILEDVAEELGMEVKDAEIAEAIQKAYKFQDPNQYNLMLQSRGVTAEDFESMLKLDLTRNKLLNFFSQRYLISDKEAEKMYETENTKIKAKVVHIRNSNFAKDVGEISEADVRAVFDKEKDNLKIPEKRSVKYLMVSAPMIRMSVEIPEEELKNYYEMNKSKFGEKPFEQVKMQAKNMLLFSDEKYKNLVKDTYDKATEEFKKVKDEKDIEEFAKKYKLEIKTTKPMSKDFPEPPFTADPKAKDAVFSAEKGKWSESFEGPMGSLRFCVTEISEPRPATYEDVKDEIRNNIKNERLMEMAKKKAYELKSRFKDPKTFEEEAKKSNYQVQDSQEIKLSDPVPFVGKNEDFARKIFESEVNQIMEPYQTKDGYALVIPLEKKPADMQKFKAEKSKFIDKKTREMAEEYVQELVSQRRQKLEAKGEISINQDILKQYDTQKES
jgi:peptidyl-prolyl cis-trans isomerase D